MTMPARIGSIAACVVVLLLIGSPARAQGPPPLDLPSEPRPEIPIPDDVRSPELVVPDADAPRAPRLGDTVTLRAIRIEGNTLLSDDVLRASTRPYLSRPLTGNDLERLRLDLTDAYVERGWVTSGALLPDQDLSGGTLVIEIREGRLARVVVEGTEHLRDAYVARRIAPKPAAPVHVPTLELRLQLLQRDPMIDRVDARLEPAEALGESRLVVRIEESRRAGADIRFSNDRSPVIGAENVDTVVGARNLTGFGDTSHVGFRVSAGLRDVQAGLTVPLGHRDTRLGLRGRWASSRVVEDPFTDLDIESDFSAVELGLDHPVFRNARDEVRLGLAFDWRRGRNTLGGIGFSFAEGSDRGESVVLPLRLVQDWTRRSRSEVIAVRSKLSFGLPIAGATSVPGAEADARFVSWILQGQWARRFDRARGLEVFSRTNLQLASDPLLPIEQFSLGGHASVRGYRENTFVSDDGVDASIELRMPLWRRADGRSILQAATFVDVGHGWSHPDRTGSASTTLASVGLGLRTDPNRWLHAELYWGQPLVDPKPSGSDPQDYGIYFSIAGTSW